MAVNKMLARVLKAAGPRGEAGDVIGSLSIRDPFPILVSHAEGTTDELQITAARRKQLKAGWTIEITVGNDTQTATIRENITFVKDSRLRDEFWLQLEDPITVPTGGYADARATVTPEPPPDDAEVTFERLSDADSLKVLARVRRDDGTSLYRMNAGALEEKADARDIMEIRGPLDASGTVLLETHPTDVYTVTFTVRRKNGTVKDTVNRPAWRIIDRVSTLEYKVPIVNGVGTKNFSLATGRKIRLGASDEFQVADPLILRIAEV